MSLSNIPDVFDVHDVSKLYVKGNLAFQYSPSTICGCSDVNINSLVVLEAYSGSEDHVIKVFKVFNSTHDKQRLLHNFPRDYASLRLFQFCGKVDLTTDSTLYTQNFIYPTIKSQLEGMFFSRGLFPPLTGNYVNLIIIIIIYAISLISNMTFQTYSGLLGSFDLRWPNTVCARFTDSFSDAVKRALGLW